MSLPGPRALSVVLACGAWSPDGFAPADRLELEWPDPIPALTAFFLSAVVFPTFSLAIEFLLCLGLLSCPPMPPEPALLWDVDVALSLPLDAGGLPLPRLLFIYTPLAWLCFFDSPTFELDCFILSGLN